MRGLVGNTIAVSLLACGWLAGHEAPRAEGPLEIGHQERADLHLVLDWPFTVAAKRTCDGIGPGDLTVREDGVPVTVTRLRRAASRTTHLLLIDTSKSMSPDRGTRHRRLKQAKLAARHYVDLVSGGLTVRDDDRLGVITFDDDLLMRSPAVRIADRERLALVRGSIERIEGGYDTAFLDGLYRLVDTLDGLDERVVLILISDGEDTASSISEPEVRRLIARANNVMIYGIGIGLSNGPHRSLLNFMAETSGGHYYDVLGSKDDPALRATLQDHFTDIHERLTHQYSVSYITERIGLPEADGDDFVEVDIKLPSEDCRVSGYKRQRYVRPNAGSAFQAGVHWKLPDAPSPAETAVVFLGIRDFDRDAGPLAVWGAAPQGPPSRVPLMKDRTVELLVPQLDKALAAGTLDPVELVDAWLDTQVSPDGTAVPPASHLGPRLVNGKAFLHNRDLLARALFESFPDYRSWVRSKLTPELRSRYREALPADVSDDQVDLIVKARLDSPRTEDLEHRLARWLADVPTAELAFALERKWANAWAEGTTTGGPDLDQIRARWRVLVDWLKPPDRARVAVPLLLAFDAEREAFGFYRIVLPRLRQLPESEVPGRPIGLELLARWPRDGGSADCLRILDIEHHALLPKEFSPEAFPRRLQRERDLYRLRLSLGGPSCATTDLDLVMEVTEATVAPLCLVANVIRGEAGAGPSAPPLAVSACDALAR